MSFRAFSILFVGGFVLLCSGLVVESIVWRRVQPAAGCLLLQQTTGDTGVEKVAGGTAQQPPMIAGLADYTASGGLGQTVIIGAEDPNTEDPTVGFKFQLEMVSRGASIARATFSNGRGRGFDDRDPKEPKPLVVLSPVAGEILSMANRQFVLIEQNRQLDLGKLSWKSEFAVRWKALDIRFEAYGKDIEDSVRINDRICREILQYEPPMHARYEMFLDKSGKKISKSAGNVFTPQVWLRYGSSQSLILLMLKRFTGTRELSVVDIPKYMNEFDELEDIYFGKKQIANKKELAKLTGLYKYCCWLNPPSKPSIHIPYNLLAYITKIAPEDRETEYVTQKLREYGHLKDKELPLKGLKERIQYAINWNHDFMEIKETSLKLTANETDAIKELVETFQGKINAEIIQSAIFNIAREHDIPPKRFFKTLYTILFGTPAGPRLGPYIIAMGKQNVTEALLRAVN